MYRVKDLPPNSKVYLNAGGGCSFGTKVTWLHPFQVTDQRQHLPICLNKCSEPVCLYKLNPYLENNHCNKKSGF